MSKFDISNYLLVKTSVFRHEAFINAFSAFLLKESAYEQLEFIFEVEKYIQITSEKEQIEKAKQIINTFIKVKANRELNLSSDNRSELLQSIYF
jgi:hypothetical protein